MLSMGVWTDVTGSDQVSVSLKVSSVRCSRRNLSQA